MDIKKEGEEVYVILGEDEDIYTLLKDKEGKINNYKHTVTAIKNEEKNKVLWEKRKEPWWLGTGDKIYLPLKEKKEEKDGEAREGWRYTFQMHRYPKIIDVYLGFMDEEVNARLAKLIDIEAKKGEDKTKRPVILVERGKVEPKKPILEWRLGNYEIGGKETPVKKIIHVSPKGEMTIKKDGEEENISLTVKLKEKEGFKNFFLTRKYWLKKQAEKLSKKEGSTEPENILARAMAVFMEYDISSDLDWLARGLEVKRYFDLMKMLQHRGNPKTKSKLPDDATGEEGPWLSVVRFDVGDSTEAPIIVIRTPEMGLQPSLMCPYLAFLLKAVSATSSQLAAEETKTKKWVVTGSKEKLDGEEKEEYEVQEEEEAGNAKMKTRDIWEWPLRVSQFGAQGSSSEELAPGTTVTVVASLFVGVEIASDITVTATDNEKKRTVTAKFKGSEDGTERAPHRVVPDRAAKREEESKRDEAKEKGEKGDHEPDNEYREYKTDKGQDEEVNAYAVISLCTPAGVYDFLREKINKKEDVQKILKDWTPEEKKEEEEKKGGKEEDKEEKGEREKGTEFKGLEKIGEAQEVAKKIFWTQKDGENQKRLKIKKFHIDEGSPYAEEEKELKEEQTLKAIISNIINTYKDKFFYKDSDRKGVVTLTLSYFGGDNDKEAADALGIKGVNMEDYHVLRVFRSALAQGVSETSDYPIILGWRVDRINCDPKTLPEGIEKKFNEYAKTPDAMLTVDDYVKVIKWGKGGLLKSEIENDSILRKILEWKFVNKYFTTIEDKKKYFYSFIQQDQELQMEEKGEREEKEDGEEKKGVEQEKGYWVPDPFCVEIATDFVNELAEIKPWKTVPGGISGIDHAIINGINAGKSEGAIARLDFIRSHEGVTDLKTFEEKINENTQEEEIINTWFQRITGLKTKAEAVKNAEEPEGQATDLMNHIKDHCGFNANRERGDKPLLKTWLRPGKWDEKNIAEPTLQDAVEKEQKFEAAAIDRAFYKSSNMMALQTMADYFLWEGGPEEKRIPKIGKMGIEDEDRNGAEEKEEEEKEDEEEKYRLG